MIQATPLQRQITFVRRLQADKQAQAQATGADMLRSALNEEADALDDVVASLQVLEKFGVVLAAFEQLAQEQER